MQNKRVSRSKRIFAMIVLFFAIIMTGFGGKIPVQAAGEAQVGVSSATAEKGDTVTVNVSLSGNPGIWGIKVRINYDSDVLQLKAMSNGNVFPGDAAICNADKGVYVATAAGLSDVKADGTLFTAEFKVVDGAALSSYNISAVIEEANNVSGGNVSVSSGSGSVTVEKCVHSKSWVITKNPTADSEGEQQCVCSKCGEVFETQAIAATGYQDSEQPSDEPVNEPEAEVNEPVQEAAAQAAVYVQQPAVQAETEAATEAETAAETKTETQTKTATESKTEVTKTQKDTEADNTAAKKTKKSGSAVKVVATIVIIVLAAGLAAALYYFIIRRRHGRH